MLKRMSTLLMAVLLCAAMLMTACQKNGGDVPVKETNSTAKEENKETAGAASEVETSVIDFNEDPYTVTVEICVGRTGEMQDEELLEEALNEITLAKANLKVDLLPILLADHATKMSLWATTGEKIDLVMAGMMTPFSGLVASEAIQPITKELQTRAPELVEKYGALLDSVTVDGEIYALPAIMYPAEQYVFYYNMDLAKQYNIEVPEKCTSWEDIEKVFQQIVDSGMGVTPTDLGQGVPTAAELYDALADGNNHAYGVIMLGESGNEEVVNYYATDAYKELCLKRQEWLEKGYGVEDAMSAGLTYGQRLQAGTIFGYFAREGAANTKAFAQQQVGVELGAGLYGPVWMSNKHVIDYTWGVSINSERPDKCVDLLNLMYTDAEVMNLMANGIEGREYVKTDGSMIIAYPEGVTAATSGWAQVISKIGDSQQLYQFQPITEDYYDNVPKYAVDNAEIVSPALGFSVDSSNIQAEIASITNVIAEYKKSLTYGVVDVEETLPKFIEALNDAGMEKVIEEVNGQYQAWKAAQ